MALVREVKTALKEIGVEAHVKARGNGYVTMQLLPEDVPKVKEIMEIYGIGVGFDFNSGTVTYQIG